MNLLAAAVLALFALGITMAPWHRPNYRFPGRGLLAEAGLLATALILACLAARLGRIADFGWTIGRWMLYAAASRLFSLASLVRSVLWWPPRPSPAFVGWTTATSPNTSSSARWRHCCTRWPWGWGCRFCSGAES